MTKTQKYLYIAFGSAIFLIYVVLAVYLVRGGSSKEQEANFVTPTPIPTSSSQVFKKSSLTYDRGAVKKLQETLKAREPLSENDKTVKTRITSPFIKKGGVVVTLSKARIDYVKTADLFQGEITSVDIEGAKNEVVDWFSKKGISQDGICHLPLMFYLSENVSRQLRGENILFSPIPDGC